MPPTDYEESDIDAKPTTNKKRDRNKRRKYDVYYDNSTMKIGPSEIRENDDDDETTSLLLVQNGTKTIDDKYNYVFIIALIEGIGLLLPWNLFMCSKAYFIDYKLLPAGNADYRINFLSYAGLASQIPNAILNFLNLFTEKTGNANANGRITASILIMSGLFGVTVAFAIIDTTDFEETFFFITLVIIALINMCTGVWGNCYFGIIAQFPSRFLNATMTGQISSGLITSILMVVTKTGAPPRTAGIFFFISAILVCLLCFIFYLSLPCSLYFRSMYKPKSNTTEERLSTYEGLPYMKTFKKTWYNLFDVWLLRVVSLALYPAILVEIEQCDPNFFIPSHLYSDVIYIMFSICNITGGLMSFPFPKPSAKYMGLTVWLRLLAIPFFLLCNYRPGNRGNVPVVFFNDWLFWFVLIVYTVANGHAAGLTMVYAKQAAGEDKMMQKTAGMMAAFAQSIGFVFAHMTTLICNYLLVNL
ncbi:equilibrative nucleoside transporter 3-like [Tubulanus polymorphus]|uniref:equilibrative nucleoside transporter 3-like n=1 Tax=Tubulanus polymorphus TaxID=672921 RepID=UPI003DA24496